MTFSRRDCDASKLQYNQMVSSIFNWTKLKEAEGFWEAREQGVIDKKMELRMWAGIDYDET